MRTIFHVVMPDDTGAEEMRRVADVVRPQCLTTMAA